MARERRRQVRSRRAAVAVAFVALGLLVPATTAWWNGVSAPLAYQEHISRSAARHGVDPYLVAAVISAESGFSKDSVSPKGAIGLMQLMPATAAEQARVLGTAAPGPAELTDPATNIELGTAYLARLLRRYGDVRAALAAYNAGMAAADRWVAAGPLSESVDYPETRAYLNRVLWERTRYKTLYPGAFGGT